MSPPSHIERCLIGASCATSSVRRRSRSVRCSRSRCSASEASARSPGRCWCVLGSSSSGVVLQPRSAPTCKRSSKRRRSSASQPQTADGPSSRVLIGVALAALGLGGLSSLSRGSGAASRGFFGSIALASGFLIILGPWWLGLLRELGEERRERVRAEERAERAAHVHDSVLQTLALIQRAAGEPLGVARLARRQERELRSWLFDGIRPGSFEDAVTTLRMAFCGIEAEAEDGYGVNVECVVVGDCPSMRHSRRCSEPVGRRS